MTAREKRFKPGSLGRRMDPTKRPKAPTLNRRPKPQTKLKKPKNAPTPSFSRFNKNLKGIRPKLTKSQKRMALGGEAGESVGRATVVKSQRDARRKLLDDSINRVYKKVSEAKKIGKIKPKKKPKNPNRIKPKKKPKKP